MNKVDRTPLPPVLPALAEDLDTNPRRPHRDVLSWISRLPCPEHSEPTTGDDPSA